MPSEEDEFFAKFVTKTITGIIANDYRKIYGDKARPQSKRRVPAQSLANEEERGPNPKGVAGLHKRRKEVEGASLAQLDKMRFCKRCYGGRIYSPPERG